MFGCKGQMVVLLTYQMKIKVKHMNIIEKTFPLQSQITGNPVNIDVFVLGAFQYTIHTETEINNIRLWSIVNSMTEHVEFHWEDRIITMNDKGDLSDWPAGKLDTSIKLFAKMIRFRRGESIELTYVN